ncbi:MAG: type III-B CRISPR-associated protein Cas10/Cmr2 [Thermodesulfobacteriota bacterium]
MNNESSLIASLQSKLSSNDLYLLNVSIGPVQEFIAEARKTKDLWVGSYLLSYITFKAIEPFIEDSDCEIIYPEVSDLPFDIKRDRESVCQEELQIPSLPNHFLVIVPESKIDNIVKTSKDRLIEYWEGIYGEVKGRIHPGFKGIDNTWDSLWDDEVKDLWQYIWVAIPVSEEELNKNYRKKAEEIQRFLEERKLTRTFNWWKGSPAIKCTQCGHREVMGPVDFYRIARFWDSIHKRYKSKVRKGDRLCAICTIKRYLKAQEILDSLNEIRFDSTRDIAVIPYRDCMMKRKDRFDEKELLECVTNLRNLLRNAQKEITGIEDIEGDFLYEDELLPDKLMKEYCPEIEKDTTQYETKKTGLETPSEKLRGCLSRISESVKARPSKYYAVLFMDGDDMGKWMSGQLPLNGSVPFNKEEHKNRSRMLGNIGIRLAPNIVRGSNAFTVYSGGDDLLALVPLDYVLELAFNLRECFSEHGIHSESTNSAGIVIAHYSDSFRRVLIEGRKAVERAKEMFIGKDSLSITLILSSGTVITGGYKWYIQSNGRTSVIRDIIGKIIKWQKMDKLGPRFIYDVLGCLDRFYYEESTKKFNEKLFTVEVERLFKRHCSRDGRGQIEIPEDELKGVVEYLSMIAKPDTCKKFNVEENIEGLLRISTFIARETLGC